MCDALPSQLHIAAAEGCLLAVRLMVEAGGATIDFRDRWEHTALDEAVRVEAHEVVAYLRPLMALVEKVSAHAELEHSP